ncbi:hypothetical protein HK097_003777, partial [Rhizophlyctis rosea]
AGDDGTGSALGFASGPSRSESGLQDQQRPSYQQSYGHRQPTQQQGNGYRSGLSRGEGTGSR